MKYADYAGRAWYSLRRTLPLWCWEDNLKELVDFCPKYGIDEVIVKVDTEEFSHNLPTIDWLGSYQPVLHRIHEELDRIGVVFSLNPWVTLVHSDRGRDHRAEFPDINFMVGHDGTQCLSCACPLSQGWRKHTANLWKIYAETIPDTIWVEDDIRTFNHMPVKFGCFCDEHMQVFSQHIGRQIAREELLELILKPGKPHPYRKEWLDMQAETMIDVARVLEQAVHLVSPSTKLGLMSSGPQNHAAEGRKWQEFVSALAGPTELVSRPSLGNYSEEGLHGLYYTGDSIRLTRYAIPSGAIELSEIENYPYTQYNKSSRFTFLQSAMCLAMGCHGLTMNLFDHSGTPMLDDVQILELFRDEKAYLKAISTMSDPAGTFRGIRILHHPQTSRTKELSTGTDYKDLVPSDYAWEDKLQGLGFATTYTESDVVALSGQAVRCLREEEILSILSRGVLCDLTAARTLQDMDYGEHLGVEIKRVFARGSQALAAEHFYNTDFGGLARKYLPVTVYPDDCLLGELTLRDEAMEISEIVDPDTERLYPCTTAFKNNLGGRVVVYPFDMNRIGWRFLHPARQTQMRYVLAWLSNSRIPLFVSGGHNALPFRLDMETHTLVGVFNLSHDPWNHLELHLADDRIVDEVKVLHEGCSWQPFDNFDQTTGSLRLRYDQPVTFERPLLFTVGGER